LAARDPKGLAGRDQSPLKVREVLAACFGLGAQVLGLSLGLAAAVAWDRTRGRATQSRL